MRPLRILLVNSARRWIGEAAHTLALSEGLGKKGHQVVVGVRRGSELEGEALSRGLDLLPLTLNSRFNPLDDWRDLRDFRRILAERRIDLVHCNRGKDHWLAAAANLFGRSPTPLVRGRHVVTPARQHVFNRWLYRRATHGLLSVSHAARASLGGLPQLLEPCESASPNSPDAPPGVETGSQPGGRTSAVDRVIYAAVDSERFSPERRNPETRRSLGADDRTVLIGLVGRIQRVKGQRYFLAAAAKAARKRPETRFVLAGRGNPKQVRNLLEFADSEGLGRDRFKILGVAPNLPEIMAAFDIGVVASIGSEGSSRVALEYMASGVAIVATRVGGVPELVDEKGQGLLVDPRDSDAMAERLVLLAENSGLRGELARRGRRDALERYHPDRWISEIEEFYHAVLREKGVIPDCNESF